ncbi:hypothetical protein EDB80DRAFT_89321 [Ilyonectria destructans]|nr:hypothetical protein EDB80DRAFT_89321 [Ilyonectria destructans]
MVPSVAPLPDVKRTNPRGPVVIATASCIATYHLVWLALTGPLHLRMPSHVHRKCTLSVERSAIAAARTIVPRTSNSPSTLCSAWRSTHGKPRNMFSFCPDFHGTIGSPAQSHLPRECLSSPKLVACAEYNGRRDLRGPPKTRPAGGEAYSRRNVRVSKEPGIDGGECVGLWCGSRQGHGLGAWEALLRRAQGRRSRWIRMRDMSFSLFSSRHRPGIPCI